MFRCSSLSGCLCVCLSVLVIVVLLCSDCEAIMTCTVRALSSRDSLTSFPLPTGRYALPPPPPKKLESKSCCIVSWQMMARVRTIEEMRSLWLQQQQQQQQPQPQSHSGQSRRPSLSSFQALSP